MSVPIPEPGQLVRVRQRPFVVLTVTTSALPNFKPGPPAQAQHLVSLSSVEEDGLGEELQVIWELEPGVSCYQRSSLPELHDFDEPRRFDAFLDAVAWGAVSSADTKALQSPFRSGIEVDDYQLDPVVRALTMPRVNLLVADDVGLGKTIETGLVAQELVLRQRVRTILVVCPSSLQIQWRDEMRDKFGMEFRIIDTAMLQDLRRRRGIHVNPWIHFPRLITSVDFLKRERPLRLFRETLPSGDEPTYPRKFDLLIVDEAHNVAPSGRGKYAADSLRTSAIRTLAPHFEHKLFLTATPHNGYSESFSALLELLDNQRFARAVKPSRPQLEAVMVRRMKSELELRWDGSRRFAKREVQHLEVDYTESERAAHRNLRKYAKLRQQAAELDAAGRMATEFVLKLLKKRLFSSPAAFSTTLAKHRKSLGKGGAGELVALRRQVEELDDDFANDEEYEETVLETMEVVSGHLGKASAEEKRLLDELIAYASDAAAGKDSKAQCLIRWLKATIKPDNKWSDNRVIIFTEYRDTQKWLHDLLAASGLAGGERLKLIYGGMPLEDREKIKAAFQSSPASSDIRILLATDAASEGLNLQNHCHRLIHYEIPWNPNRMEQRNGRVDRHGQKSPEVDIFHFAGKGFDKAKADTTPGDLEGDLEFLMRAALKVETIREDIGKMGPVIAAQVEEAMLGRRHSLDTTQAERDSEPVRQMLKFERQLREQLKKLESQLHDTKRELRLESTNIRNVVVTGLALSGQPPLKVVSVPDIPEGEAFEVPILSGSWSRCIDGLAHPHTGVQRPVVFDHSLAAGRDDVVLCHLNHRLVQMCLRLLRAEIWSLDQTKKLHRFTARMVTDNDLQSPAVIAHGRLLVLGGDNQRIHEEIIMAGGILKAGRFNRFNVGEAKTAFEAATDRSAPGFIEDTLKTLWPKLEKSVLEALEARMKERTKNLRGFLDDRAEQEVRNITAVMTELEKSIREVVDKKEDPQMLFDWAESERDQRQRDLDGLARRLQEIPAELAKEVEHLRARYRDPSPKLFPVCITFLIPPRAVAELKHGGGR